MIFFFFNDTATTEIYTLSLHDALPICATSPLSAGTRVQLPHASASWPSDCSRRVPAFGVAPRDRKSTRLNSSHQIISYAVFCLKKKQPPLKSTHSHPDIAHSTHT